MKRLLITIAAVGILAPTAWVAGANAQYSSTPPGYGPSPAYSPSQGYSPSQKYTRRAYRRSAGQGSGGSTVYTPGSGPPPYGVPAQTYAAETKWEWHAGPGPSKRGGMCITHVDINRGYGFQGPCPAPKGAPKRTAAAR